MISNRCHYALRAMLELALREGRGPVTISEIATTQNIPVRFLEAILRQLKQDGLADSVRGKEGGYLLARKAHDISVGEVIRIFEGPFISTAESVSQRGSRDDEQREALADVWREAEQALTTVFDQHSFGDLAEREHQRTLTRASNYSI